MNKIDYKIIEFPEHISNGGKIIVYEKGDVPFETKRTYMISINDVNVVRGNHAHKRLQQVIVCLKGNCLFHIDNGFKKELIVLNGPRNGLFLGPNIWRTFDNFSNNCILLVIASDFYDESDYIRNYNEFLKSVKAKK